MKTITMNKRTVATVNIHDAMVHGRIAMAIVINRIVRIRQSNRIQPIIRHTIVVVAAIVAIQIRNNIMVMIQCFRLIGHQWHTIRLVIIARNGQNVIYHRTQIIIMIHHTVQTMIITSNFVVRRENQPHQMYRPMGDYSKNWHHCHGINH